MAPPNGSKIVLISIILLAAIIRLWGIGYGLSGTKIRPDEDAYVLQAFYNFTYFQGTAPGIYLFKDPRLYTYILWTIFKIILAGGYSARLFGYTGNLHDYFSADPTLLFIMGRGVSVLLGTLTVLLIYRIGKQMYSKTVGLLSAFFLCVSFLHSRNSHFAVPDISAAFFATLSIFFILKLLQARGSREYAVAGAVSGLAISAKYNLIVLAIPIVIAHLYRGPKHGKKFLQSFLSFELYASILSMALFILLLTPYLFVGFDTFSKDFLFIADRYLQGFPAEAGMVDLGPAVIYHFTFSLRYGMGLLLEALCVLGILSLMYRRNKIDVTILGFVMGFYLFIGSSRVNFIRYIIPILPLLYIFASKGVIELSRLFRSSKRKQIFVILILSAIAIAEPTYRCVRSNILLSRKDTRILAREWILQNVSQGSSILSYFRYGSPYLTDRQDNFHFYRMIDVFNDDIIKIEYDFIRKNIDFVIVDISPHPYYSHVNPSFLKLLEDHAKIKVDFDPFDKAVELSPVYDPFDAFFVPIGNFSGVVSPGPKITIYKTKDEDS